MPEVELNPFEHLNPFNHPRKRPRMYFGGADEKGFYQWLFYAVYFCLDHVIEGHASEVDVVLLKNNKIIIRMNGSRTIEQIITLICGGMGHFIGRSSIKPCFSGLDMLTAVCGTSAEFSIDVKHDGRHWQQTFVEGQKISEFGPTASVNGTENCLTLEFSPDFTIFAEVEIDYWAMFHHLRELAFLVKDAKITLIDHREQSPNLKTATFFYPEGMVDFLKHLNQNHQPLHPSIHLVEKYEDNDQLIDVDIAFQYSDASEPTVLGFINGSHCQGINSIHTQTFIQELTQFIGKHSPQISDYDILTGLAAVVSVWHPDPQLEKGTIHYELIGDDIKTAIEYTMRTLGTQLANQPDKAERITTHLLASAQARNNRRFDENYPKRLHNLLSY